MVIREVMTTSLWKGVVNGGFYQESVSTWIFTEGEILPRKEEL
jgi:hypothetical protein